MPALVAVAPAEGPNSALLVVPKLRDLGGCPLESSIPSPRRPSLDEGDGITTQRGLDLHLIAQVGGTVISAEFVTAAIAADLTSSGIVTAAFSRPRHNAHVAIEAGATGVDPGLTPREIEFRL